MCIWFENVIRLKLRVGPPYDVNNHLTRSQRIMGIIFRLVIKNFKRSPRGLTGPGNG